MSADITIREVQKTCIMNAAVDEVGDSKRWYNVRFSLRLV